MTARIISELYYKYIYIYIFIYICSQRTSKRKYAASLVTMDYGSPSKPTDHKLPKRLFYPNTRYSTSTARPSRPPTPHTKKHATNVDTGILYTTNHPQLTNRKTGNGTTYSGTTLHSAKTSAQYRTQTSISLKTTNLEKTSTATPSRSVQQHE